MRQATVSLKPNPSTAPASMVGPARLLQRKGACGGPSGVNGECSGCAMKRLSRRAVTGAQSEPHGLPSVVDDVLRSPGHPLDPRSRAFFEPRFGHDFGHVRVLADGRAGEAARSVGARAFSVGRDLVFGANEYAPSTTGGRRLLAHELAHVMQQRHAPDHGPIAMGDGTLEREADAMESAPSPVVHRAPPLRPFEVCTVRLWTPKRRPRPARPKARHRSCRGGRPSRTPGGAGDVSMPPSTATPACSRRT